MAITPVPLIPAGAAATVNRLLARMRDDSCVIQRQGAGKDLTGAPSGAFTTVATEPCRVTSQGLQPVESVGGSRLASVVAYEVRFEPDVDVRGNDRIQVNGKTLEVIGDQDAVSHGFQLVVIAKIAGA